MSTRFAAKQKTGTVHLVGGGVRAYLWCAAPFDAGGLTTLHGPTTLRKLARAILREVPAPKKPKPRKRSRAGKSGQ
jgi:hypothetical protein